MVLGTSSDTAFSGSRFYGSDHLLTVHDNYSLSFKLTHKLPYVYLELRREACKIRESWVLVGRLESIILLDRLDQ